MKVIFPLLQYAPVLWLFVEMFVELLYQRAMPLPWADSPAEEEAGGGGASREGTSMGVSWGCPRRGAQECLPSLGPVENHSWYKLE